MCAYVAVCCRALQCSKVCCSVLQCVAVCCNGLQYVAMGCSMLQWVAVCYSVYIRVHAPRKGSDKRIPICGGTRPTATYLSTQEKEK